MKIKIKKGKHDASGLHVRPYLGKRIISWRVNMDISCLYKAINDDSNDLNKLCGVSFGHHHKNSLRFAWTPDFNRPGQFMIYAYWYAEGQRRSLYIANISHNVDFDLEIILDHPTVAFVAMKPNPVFSDEKRSVFVNFKVPCPSIGYYLWPYFGGNNAAPHEMSIDLKVI